MSSYTALTSWHRPVGGIDFETTKAVPWEMGAKGSNFWIIVPKDFTFQCSVPRGLRWLVNPMDPRFRKASCLHDWLLAAKGWNRVAAGAVFHEALAADRVPRLRRLAMWLTVSLFRYR